MASFKLSAHIVNSTEDEWYGRQCNSCPKRLLLGDTILVIDHKESYVQGTRGVHVTCVKEIMNNAMPFDVDKQFLKIQDHAAKTGKLLGVS